MRFRPGVSREVQTQVTLDPTQTDLFWAYHRLDSLWAGKRLMWAMIQSAVEDIRRVRRTGRLPQKLRLARTRQRDAAIAWVFSDDTTWSHSFINCFEALGWWPGSVQQLIWREIKSTEPLTVEDPDTHRLRSDIRQKPRSSAAIPAWSCTAHVPGGGGSAGERQTVLVAGCRRMPMDTPHAARTLPTVTPQKRRQR